MPLFNLGQLLITPAAQEAISQGNNTTQQFLRRHARGDWGTLSREDEQANEDALKSGARLLSVYFTAKQVKLWVITEAADDEGRRAATTILLPEEY